MRSCCHSKNMICGPVLLFTAEDYARLCHYQDIIDLMRSAPSIATWDAGNVVMFHTKISLLESKDKSNL